MYVTEICAEGISVTLPWWLKNVKSRSKIALFPNESHFETWFPKKKTITFFWSKLSQLHTHKKNACGNYIYPKTRGNKNKPWSHSTPLKVLKCCATVLISCVLQSPWFKKVQILCKKGGKKMFVCPFPTDPRFWIFFFFFFLIFSFTFSSKTVEIIIFKIQCNCPKS